MLEMGYEGRAKGRLNSVVRAGTTVSVKEKIGTLPAPAGPMTRTPNLLILVTVEYFVRPRGAIKKKSQCFTRLRIFLTQGFGVRVSKAEGASSGPNPVIGQRTWADG